MTSGEKIKELREYMTDSQIKDLAKRQMDKSWSNNPKLHYFWLRVYNNV